MFSDILASTCAVGASCTADVAGPSGPGVDPSGGFARATLVICPVVAVIQWQSEIERFTVPGSLKVRGVCYAKS